jgi:glycosyltransferase involved in cell wall biosynthesis
VELVSASFNEHTGTGIIEYGVRLAKALEKEGGSFDYYRTSLIKGNVFGTPKHLYKETGTSNKIENPDIIHYMDPGFVTIDATIKRWRLRNKNIIVTIHDLDVFKNVNEGFKLATKYTNPLAFLRRPLAAIVTPFAIIIRLAATKFIVKRAKKIICVSENTMNDVIKTFNLKKEMCVVIYPIIGNEFRPINVKKKSKKTIIGHLSSYLPNKNAGTLINAFKKTKSKNLELHLYGPVPPFKINDDKRIKYFGFIPTEKIVEALNSFDVFVFPSTWEGFGAPAMEAKKCKIPVITYSKGKLPDIIKRNTLQFDNEEHLIKIFENSEWKKVDINKAYLDVRKCDSSYVAKQVIRVYKKALKI